MSRPVTLFTGQWADLPLAELAPKVKAMGYDGVDYVKFIREFPARIFHAHMKDVWWGHGDGTVGVFGGHTDFTDPRRFWDFRSLGHGDIRFEDIIVALNDVEADAVRLLAGGRDFGWTWRTNGEVRFEVKLSQGTHRLCLELVPNTFNAFGPHHYFGGDWPAISPDQFKGVRNFADPADASANTHVKAWHFRRLQIPQTVFLS